MPAEADQARAQTQNQPILSAARPANPAAQWKVCSRRCCLDQILEFLLHFPPTPHCLRTRPVVVKLPIDCGQQLTAGDDRKPNPVNSSSGAT